MTMPNQLGQIALSGGGGICDKTGERERREREKRSVEKTTGYVSSGYVSRKGARDAC